jgi:hypothetical protein
MSSSKQYWLPGYSGLLSAAVMSQALEGSDSTGTGSRCDNSVPLSAVVTAVADLQEEIEAFVAADPYVVNGLVPSWKLQPFAVVVGSP